MKHKTEVLNKIDWQLLDKQLMALLKLDRTEATQDLINGLEEFISQLIVAHHDDCKE